MNKTPLTHYKTSFRLIKLKSKRLWSKHGDLGPPDNFLMNSDGNPVLYYRLCFWGPSRIINTDFTTYYIVGGTRKSDMVRNHAVTEFIE